QVEVEGKLYSVPEAVEMISRTHPVAREKWWKVGSGHRAHASFILSVARKARVLSRGIAADLGDRSDDEVDNGGDGEDNDGDDDSNHNGDD
ncbi:unnamed protein product, partial [Hapterophycus canaliculatus]